MAGSSNPTNHFHCAEVYHVCRTMQTTLHMLPYADTYAAMFVSGYISGPICRMLSMRTRMQMHVYRGKVWTNIGSEMQICDG